MQTIRPYVVRAYEALKKFSAEPHHGLTLALGDELDLKQVVVDITELTANKENIIRPELVKLFGDYNGSPVLFTDAIYDVFQTMTNEHEHLDSLLSFNREGHIIPVDGFLCPSKDAFQRIKYHDPDWGMRHLFSIASSCYPGVTTMALSESRGTVTTFYDGNVDQRYCFNPAKK
jgi:hypothetical protein